MDLIHPLQEFLCAGLTKKIGLEAPRFKDSGLSLHPSGVNLSKWQYNARARKDKSPELDDRIRGSCLSALRL